MEQKDLTGYRFTDSKGTEYQVLAGCEGSETVYEVCGGNAPFDFCCDAQIAVGKLKGSYCVSYTVSKEEFFADIEALSEKSKKNADTIASALREKYYKIPTAFLKLFGAMWLKDGLDR